MTHTVAERNAERHKHDVPRCKACGRYLPKREAGQNRIVCDCGAPNNYWVKQ